MGIDGVITAGVNIALFIVQWVFVLEILWISTIVVPFTIMSVTFFLINWLILDRLTTFLISGSWNTVDQILITATSPIMIMLYVAIFFGLLFLVVFFINYFARTALNINISEIVKRCFWIFGFILFTCAIPFFLIFFSMFVKFCTSLISKIFNNNFINDILTSNPEILSFIQTLSNYQIGPEINKEYWNNLWSSITDQNLLAIKDKIYNAYNQILKDMKAINWDNLIFQLQLSASNPASLKEIFNRPDLIKTLNNIYNNSSIIYQCLGELNNNSLISEEMYLNICGCLGDFSGRPELEDFNNALNNLIMNASIYQNIEIDSETGEIIQTENIGFILYTAVTGIPCNSIKGIWDNIAFVSGLFRTNGIENLVKSIMLGGAVAIASAKGIMQLISILIYRWMWILSSVPYGSFAAARSVNDNGTIFKLYFRETITSFVSLFVVALNLQIMTLLVSLITDGFKQGNIIIPGLNGNNVALTVTFIIIVIICIYSCIAITQKVLEIFNNSSIAKDNAVNTLTQEYNSFKNNKNQRVNSSNQSRREINKSIHQARKNTSKSKAKVSMKK